MQDVKVFKLPKYLDMDFFHVSFKETLTVFKSEAKIATLLEWRGKGVDGGTGIMLFISN